MAKTKITLSLTPAASAALSLSDNRSEYISASIADDLCLWQRALGLLQSECGLSGREVATACMSIDPGRINLNTARRDVEQCLQSVLGSSIAAAAGITPTRWAVVSSELSRTTARAYCALILAGAYHRQAPGLAQTLAGLL